MESLQKRRKQAGKLRKVLQIGIGEKEWKTVTEISIVQTVENRLWKVENLGENVEGCRHRSLTFFMMSSMVLR